MATNARYIISGPEDDYDIPNESIGKIIFDRLKKRDSEEIISIDAATKEVLTCGTYLDQTVKLTGVLKGFGVQKGDVICIVSENTVNYFIPIVAAFYMGVAVTPSNYAYSSGELAHNLRLAKPKLIFCTEKALETVLKVKDELDSIKTVLVMGHTSGKYSHIDSYENLVAASTFNVDSFKPDEFDCSQQLAYIIFSSGTTGLPKGVLITHKNLRTGVGGLGHPRYGNVTSNDSTITIIPFFHIYGNLIHLLGFFNSMKSIIMNKFNPDLFLNSIEEYKVTKLFIVTPIVHFLAKSPLVEKYDLSTIKMIYVGGAPLSKALQTEAAKRLHTISIRQLYGLTEGAAALHIQPEINKPGSVGTLIPGVIAKVWNSDTKQNVGPMENGEICFKGSSLMKGYLPAQDCFDEDGFFHTGDVGYYDHDGYFYIVDRIKELIKYKAFQVSPVELEALLLTHPLVKDCGVIGIPDDIAGELPLAFVVLEKDVTVTQQEIIDFVAERISIQKRLHGGVRFIAKIPKTPSGKIVRRELLNIFNNLP